MCGVLRKVMRRIDQQKGGVMVLDWSSRWGWGKVFGESLKPVPDGTGAGNRTRGKANFKEGGFLDPVHHRGSGYVRHGGKRDIPLGKK